MKSKKLEKQNLLQAEQELLSMYRKNNVEDKTHIYEFIKKYKNEGPEENHPIIQMLLFFGYAHFSIEGVIEDDKLTMYKECLEIFTVYKRYELACLAHIGISLHHRKKHRYAESLRSIQDAELLAIKRLGINTRIYVDLLINKASIYWFLRDLDKCHNSLLQCNTIELNESLDYAAQFVIHTNLTRNYMLYSDLDKATYHFDICKEITKHYRNEMNYSAMFIHGSALLIKKEEWEEAIALLKEGYDFYINTSFHLRKAELLKIIGEFYVIPENPLYDYSASIPFLKQAIAIGEEHEFYHFVTAVYTGLYQNAKTAKLFEESLEYLEHYFAYFLKMHNEKQQQPFLAGEIRFGKESHQLFIDGKQTTDKKILEDLSHAKIENTKLLNQLSDYEKIISTIKEDIAIASNRGQLKSAFAYQLLDKIQGIIKQQLDIQGYLRLCEQKYPGIIKNLQRLYPNLTKTEIKILQLIRLDLTSQMISELCSTSLKNIENHRLRIRKKLQLLKQHTFTMFLDALPNQLNLEAFYKA